MKKKNLTVLGTCLLASVIMFLIYFILGSISYEADDDEAMNLIAAGAFGSQNRPFLVFSNIVYGKIVYFLFDLFPKHNMYLFLMLFLNLICMFIVSYVLSLKITDNLERANDSFNIIDTVLVSGMVTVFINWLLGDIYYDNLQFSKNSGLYTVVGFMLLYIWFISYKSLRKLIWLPGVLLLWLGYMVRESGFLAAMLECFAVIAAFILLDIKKYIKLIKETGFKIVKNNLGLLLILIITASGIISMKIANDKAYSRADWKEFLEFNYYRSELIDFYFPPYDGENAEKLKSIGFSSNDYLMMASLVFADKDTFNTETLKMIDGFEKDSPRKLEISKDKIVKLFHGIEGVLYDRKICIFWISVLLILLLMSGGKTILLYFLTTMGILVEYWYLACQGRIIWRAGMISWLTAIIMFFVVVLYNNRLEIHKFDNMKRVSIVLIAGVLVFSKFADLYTFSFVAIKDKHICIQDTDMHDMFTGFDKDNLYVFSLTSYGISVVDDIYKIDRSYEDYFSNISVVGGWTVFSPLRRTALDRYGVDDNVFQAFVTHDNVYLVDNYNTHYLIWVYLNEIFDGNVEYEVIDTVGGNNIYKYYIE